MMAKIATFSYGRVKSQRCPNKMLRSFADTSLADILLDKLKNLGDDTFFAGHEAEFRRKAAAHGVRFVQRTKASASSDGPIFDVFGFLRSLDFDYFLVVNGCLPFLSLETIDRFRQFAERGDLRPCAAVTSVRNYFFNKQKQPINFPVTLKTLNTKTAEPVLAFANALYFFKKEYFFEHGCYWDWADLNLFIIDRKLELVDVDDEEDFRMAEGLWKTLSDK